MEHNTTSHSPGTLRRRGWTPSSWSPGTIQSCQMSAETNQKLFIDNGSIEETVTPTTVRRTWGEVYLTLPTSSGFHYSLEGQDYQCSLCTELLRSGADVTKQYTEWCWTTLACNLCRVLTPTRMGCTFSLPLRWLCLTWRSSSSLQLARAEDSSELPSEPHEYAVRRPSHTPYAVTLWFWGNTFLMTFSQIIRTYWKVGVRLQEGNGLSNRNLQLWDIRPKENSFYTPFLQFWVQDFWNCS